MTNFNSDLAAWDVSAVTDMRYMFDTAINFNGDLTGPGRRQRHQPRRL